MRWIHEMGEGLRIAVESVWANKLRSALATIGIVIGVFTVTLMATAIQGLTTAFTNSISALGTDVIYIERFGWGPSEDWWKVRTRQPITISQARRMTERATMVEAVSYESNFGGTVKYRDTSAQNVIIAGNTERSDLVRGLTIKEGRFINKAEVDGLRPVCVLGIELADQLFPHGGSIGEWVHANNQRYQVIGVLDKMGAFLFANLDYQIIVPITRMVSDMKRDPDVTIAIKVGDPALLDEAQEEVRWIMRAIRKVPPGEEEDFSINNQSALMDAFGTFAAIAGTAGLSITGLALFVGGIGIMNVMFVSVTERTQEIGVRKALGAKHSSILTQFLMEAILICLLGGLLALSLAWPSTWIMRNWLPATLSWPIMGMALGVAAITGMIAGFLPANRAARLKPVDALRSE